MINPILHKIMCRVPTIGKDGVFRKGAPSESHIEKIMRTAVEKTTPYIATAATAALIFYSGTKNILEKKEKQV